MVGGRDLGGGGEEGAAACKTREIPISGTKAKS